MNLTQLVEILDGIEERFGQVTPELVVDEARSKTSLLHPEFEWNDKLAGELYRHEQAQALIRRVKIKYTDRNGEEQVVRKYFTTREPGDPPFVYRSIDKIAADPIAAEALRRQAEREARALWDRYRHIEEFIQLWKSFVS